MIKLDTGPGCSHGVDLVTSAVPVNAEAVSQVRSARRSSTPPSQIDRLGVNLVIPRLEGPPRDNVDCDAQEFLKVLEQADAIKKGGAWLKVHEQV
jgi:hypothetical protein